MHKKTITKKQPKNRIHKFTSTQIYRYTTWVDVCKETKCTKKTNTKKIQKNTQKKIHNLPGWMCAKRQSSEKLLCCFLQVHSSPKNMTLFLVVFKVVKPCTEWEHQNNTYLIGKHSFPCCSYQGKQKQKN